MSIGYHPAGHNNGPVIATGLGYRKHCWTKARAALLPKLLIEVIRGRLKRAKELGLDYKSYASIGATSGHDVVAFLFSSNALRVLKGQTEMPSDRVVVIGDTALERECCAAGRMAGYISAEAYFTINAG